MQLDDVEVVRAHAGVLVRVDARRRGAAHVVADHRAHVAAREAGGRVGGHRLRADHHVAAQPVAASEAWAAFSTTAAAAHVGGQHCRRERPVVRGRPALLERDAIAETA
ncbi:MAG: hypothetical protein R2736_18700 [Solirubrobacterales bacterium]